MGALALTKTTLTSAVANGGTLTVGYPSGQTQAKLTGSNGGVVTVNNNDIWKQGTGTGTVAFAFNASDITITNNSGVTWAQGSELNISFGRVDRNGSYNLVIGTEANTAKAGNL